MKMAPNSQIVRAKENLKLSQGGPSQRQASYTMDERYTLGPSLNLRPEPPLCNEKGKYSYKL